MSFTGVNGYAPDWLAADFRHESPSNHQNTPFAWRSCTPPGWNGERERILIRCREALTNEQGEAVVILKVRRTASGLQREFPFGTRPYTLEKNVLILSSNVYGRYRACSSRFIFVLRTNLRTWTEWFRTKQRTHPRNMPTKRRTTLRTHELDGAKNKQKNGKDNHGNAT